MRWIVLTLMLLMLVPGVANANGMPVNRWPPEAGLVPQRGARTEVTAEALTFDFRAADNTLNNWPQVTARYSLRNPSGSDEQLTIAFLHLRETLDLKAEWNGTLLPVEIPTEDQLGRARQPLELLDQRELLWLNPADGKVYRRETGYPSQLYGELFSLTVPAGGTGELRVTYSQQPTACDKCLGRRPFWHYTYLLSPARNWATFHNLQVRVILPPAYQAATVPSLTRQDSAVLVGSFNDLPEGELHISVRKEWWPAYGERTCLAGAAVLAIACALGWRRRKTNPARA